ncbi:ABC transporter ATP-binding protein [Thomasclavelia saccharogumia]|uniref:ABC transporter ATP-binding protein n=1 Tax=Thomasclavelia saccharogumia TaxID=341225 RepID=UPI00047A0AD1|nr:ABC transporter ATP-binding protein [Thomasclavelia saccharogumia]
MIKKIKHYIKRIKEGRLKELVSQWLWMGSYMKRYWFLIGTYTLLGASGSFLTLGTSMVSRDLVDAITGQNSLEIVKVVALYVGVGVSQLFINAFKTRLSLRISMKVNNEIRIDIFSQILQTDWEELSKYRTGDLMYRINGDAAMVSNNILTYLPNVVSILISFGGAFIVMVQNDIIMALIALAGAPISFMSTRFSMRKMRDFQRKQMELQSHKTSFNQETLQNMQMIKAFGLVDYFIKQYKDVQDQSIDYAMIQNKFQSKMTILTGFIGQLIGYACYGFAAYRLWQGDISYGTMTLYVSMSSSLRGSFSSVLNLLPTAMRAGISAGRIMEIIQLPRESLEDEQEAKKLLAKAKDVGITVEMKDVSFRYGDNPYVYQNANMIASPGEIIGLIGPSGQGKTTTLRILLGLYHPKAGAVTVSNPGYETIPISSGTRCLFSYIPQGNTLFSGTIADNMKMLRPDASDEEIIEVLKTACAWEFVAQLENGIHTEVSEGGNRFSEGQKQRLSIARALMAKAPVLLLDEATSALDMVSEKKVLRNILHRDPLQTIIVTAHRPSVLSICDRVYKIQEGRIDEVDEEEIEAFLNEV